MTNFSRHNERATLQPMQGALSQIVYVVWTMPPRRVFELTSSTAAENPESLSVSNAVVFTDPIHNLFLTRLFCWGCAWPHRAHGEGRAEVAASGLGFGALNTPSTSPTWGGY